MGKVAKKYRRLEISEKIAILSRLEKGESISKLAAEYNVTHPTICRMKKKKNELDKYIHVIKENDGSLKKKVMNYVEHQPLDKALFTWFQQRRLLGEPVSGPLLKAKAAILNQKLNGPDHFKASNGWLWRFKQRHGIRELSIQGESLSNDNEAARLFLGQFSAEVIEEGYDPENIYNADESGLLWKNLPRKTLASRSEQTAKGRKILKDRVTFMVCTNATGSHKLKIMIIGKSKKPRCFKNVNNLPVIYKNQKSSWMDTKLFEQWFLECFIPEVEKEHIRTKRGGKVILLVDNAPCHKLSAQCVKENPDFVLKFFPPSVTAIIQPMDQGIIEKLKRIYQRNFLTELLLGENEENVIQLLKKMTLKDCCYMIANAWETVTVENVRNAWKSLNVLTTSENNSLSQTNDVTETLNILRNIHGCGECEEEDTIAWFNSDHNDPGWEILTDEAIVALSSEQTLNVQNEVIEESEEEELDSDLDPDEPNNPTAKEALLALKVLSRWLETADKCDQTQLCNLGKIGAMIRTALYSKDKKSL